MSSSPRSYFKLRRQKAGAARRCSVICTLLANRLMRGTGGFVEGSGQVDDCAFALAQHPREPRPRRTRLAPLYVAAVHGAHGADLVAGQRDGRPPPPPAATIRRTVFARGMPFGKDDATEIDYRDGATGVTDGLQAHGQTVATVDPARGKWHDALHTRRIDRELEVPHLHDHEISRTCVVPA